MEVLIFRVLSSFTTFSISLMLKKKSRGGGGIRIISYFFLPRLLWPALRKSPRTFGDLFPHKALSLTVRLSPTILEHDIVIKYS